MAWFVDAGMEGTRPAFDPFFQQEAARSEFDRFGQQVDARPEFDRFGQQVGKTPELDGFGQKVKLTFSGVGDVVFDMGEVKRAIQNQDQQKEEGLVDWLANKLEDERREILQKLQEKHIDLIEQFLEMSYPNNATMELATFPAQRAAMDLATFPAQRAEIDGVGNITYGIGNSTYGTGPPPDVPPANVQEPSLKEPRRTHSKVHVPMLQLPVSRAEPLTTQDRSSYAVMSANNEAQLDVVAAAPRSLPRGSTRWSKTNSGTHHANCSAALRALAVVGQDPEENEAVKAKTAKTDGTLSASAGTASSSYRSWKKKSKERVSRYTEQVSVLHQQSQQSLTTSLMVFPDQRIQPLSSAPADNKGSADSRFTLDNNHNQTWEQTRTGQMFEVSMAVMILINTLCMALDAQYKGLTIGYTLSVKSYTHPGDEAWPGGDITFDVLEKFFTVLFTLEFLFRFYIHRWNYFFDRWCYIDGLIVFIAWILLVGLNILKINVTFVRLCRFTKLIRLLHLLRSQEIFDSLKLLVAAIKASIIVLFWSLTVILLIQAVAGLGMVQIIAPFLQDKSEDPEIRRRIFIYFGTFWRSMVTMFEITFANWAPSCRLLMDHVSELYGVFYLMYRCVIGFCVLMVVQAVFIQQTMKTTKLDDVHLALQKARQREALTARLEHVFNMLDEDQDGFVSWEEMQPIFQSSDLTALFEVFDIEVTDFASLFHLLDDGDGMISIDEFVRGVQNVKGAARELSVLEALKWLKELDAKFDAFMSSEEHPVKKNKTSKGSFIV